MITAGCMSEFDRAMLAMDVRKLPEQARTTLGVVRLAAWMENPCRGGAGRGWAVNRQAMRRGAVHEVAASAPPYDLRGLLAAAAVPTVPSQAERRLAGGVAAGVRPARLDADGTAQPLTRLVAHVPAGACVGPTVQPDALEVRATGELTGLTAPTVESAFAERFAALHAASERRAVALARLNAIRAEQVAAAEEFEAAQAALADAAAALR